MSAVSVSHGRLRHVLDYNPDTGIFRWKHPTSKKFKAGDVAGTAHTKGYVSIVVDRKAYLAHRLAWLWMTGGWPEDQLDHRDLDRSNNAFANLRVAGACGNQANTGLSRNNTSGFKGVHWNKRKQRWAVEIDCQRERHFLGYFTNKEAAAAAYAEAAQRLHGEFARAA